MPTASKYGKPQLDPILCICYTNHALDQFLEALLRSTVVQTHEIVRIGSRSKSELLQACSLAQVALQKASGAEKYEFSLKRGECQRLQEDILSLLGHVTWKNRAGGTEHFQKWLEQNEGRLFSQITGRNKEEGEWEIAGGFGAAMTKFIAVAKTKECRREREIQMNDAKQRYEQSIRMSIESLNNELKVAIRSLSGIAKASRTSALRNARIIGCTTTGAAKHCDMLAALGSPVVVCEEAAEVLEAHVISALTSRTQHLILIGDHLQLRPKVSEYELSQDANRNYDLDVSLFDRIARDNVFPIATLNTQRRMHPVISAIPRMTLYPNLLDSAGVLSYPPHPRGFKSPLFFVTHNIREGNPDAAAGSSSSYNNDHEAKFLCALARYVIRQGYSPDQIALLTPYLAQLVQIRKYLMKEQMSVYLDERNLQDLEGVGASLSDPSDDCSETGNATGDHGWERGTKDEAFGRTMVPKLKECVRLSTVDNFQGEEAEIVLISTVRCNERGRVGFLKSENRVNVMLTRAKHGMFIIGSEQTIRRAPDATAFNTVLDYVTEKNFIGTHIPLKCEKHGTETLVSSSAEIPSDGGCREFCLERKKCGHVCQRRCHPDDTKHRIADCVEACTRIIEECGHPCRLACFEKCGNCQMTVNVRLACGHSITSICNRKEAVMENHKCMVVIEENITGACGHVYSIRCWENGQKICRNKCGRTRDCGHECIRFCFECQSGNDRGETSNRHAGKCEKRCHRTLVCGHLCEQKPCHSATECPPCSKPCGTLCEHSQCALNCKEVCYACSEKCTWKCSCEVGLECDSFCATPCRRLPCDNRCQKLIECGHQCPGLCGEKCLDKKFCVECVRQNADHTKNTSDQVVDMILFSKLNEISYEDLPLIQLDCDHVFTMETLDGILDIGSYYTTNEHGTRTLAIPISDLQEKEVGPFAISNEGHPKCPTCKRHISNVHRYKRATSLFSLTTLQRKWILTSGQTCSDINANTSQLSLRLDTLTESMERSKLANSEEGRNVLREVKNLCRQAETLIADARKGGPTSEVYRKESGLRQLTKNHAHRDEEVEFVKPEILPLLMALQSRLLVLLLDTRCACFGLSKDSGRHAKASILPERKENESNGSALLETLDNLNIQTEKLYKELLRLCERGKYGKRRQSAINTYAMGIYKRFFALRALEGKGDSVIPSAREMREECIERLTEMMYMVDGISADDIKELRKIEDGFREEMTLEEKKMIYKAMSGDIGTARSSFATRWSTCPEGHIYAIGECGGAVQESTCPECGSVIGGTGHQLAPGNRPASEFMGEVMNTGESSDS